MNGIGMHGVEGLGTLYTVGRSYWGQLHASLSLSHNELTSSHGVGWDGVAKGPGFHGSRVTISFHLMIHDLWNRRPAYLL